MANEKAIITQDEVKKLSQAEMKEDTFDISEQPLSQDFYER